MGKALKGCVNEKCIAYKKKMHFKDSDAFCPKCGQPLYHVCKRCGMQLPDDTRKYCIRCENEIKDQRDEWGKTLINGVGQGVSKAGKAISDGSKQAVKLAEDTTKDLKDKTGKIAEAIDNRQFKLPEEYKKSLKRIKKKDLYFPMRNTQLYTINTEGTSATILLADVDEEYAMDFDDSQKVIDSLHEDIQSNPNFGLIEVKNGLTQKNNRFIYSIRKMSKLDDGIPQGVNYLININVEFNGKIKFVQGSFEESGMTGMRDSLVFSQFTALCKSMDEAIEKWNEDPYDSNFKDGFLMNRSETEKFDESFPDHPLTHCRKLVEYIITNN